MKKGIKIFAIIGVVFSLLVIGYLGLNWWTETKHDKPAHQWIQELNDKDVKDDVIDDLVQDVTNEEVSEDETNPEDESQVEPVEEMEVES